jgi:hypothetical protein
MARRHSSSKLPLALFYLVFCTNEAVVTTDRRVQ